MVQTVCSMADQPANERSPFIVTAREGDRPRLEVLISQLASARHYLLNAARDLSAGQLDAQTAGCPNTIGSLLAHVAAAETMFQNITGQGRQFSEEEEDLKQAFRFERNPLAGQEIAAYGDLLWTAHEASAGLLRTKEDSWLDTANTFAGRPSNFHYYWTHLLMDECRHTGQIILIRKHLMPGHDPSFHPYAVS